MCDSWKLNKYRYLLQSNQENKHRIGKKMKQRCLRAITLQGAKEKSQLLLSQY